MSFIYFKNQDLISESFYKENFSINYADIMKNKLQKNNPNARARFDIAKKVVEESRDGIKLF